MKVDVTVVVRGRAVGLDKVADKSLVSALRQMGADVGKKLDKTVCPEHNTPPRDVRIEVNASGNADIRYDSCCAKLKDAVGRALG